MSRKNINSTNSINSTIFTFLEFINNVKLYHWNTRKYSEHKATDKLYEKLNENMDTFVEILLSNQRLPNHKKNLSLRITNREGFIKIVMDFKKKLLSYSLQPSLMQLRDEILTDLDQFIYLLSQK